MATFRNTGLQSERPGALDSRGLGLRHGWAAAGRWVSVWSLWEGVWLAGWGVGSIELKNTGTSISCFFQDPVILHLSHRLDVIYNVLL